MKIFVYSKKGKDKAVCDDAALVADNIIYDSYFELQTENINAVAVADGVGGNAGGDYAAKYVLDRLSNASMADASAEYLKQLICDINEELLQYASGVQGKESMATTLTGLIFTSDNCYILHVGNTRLYALQGSYLKQLTEDQTTYQWLINTGQIEAAEGCNKNEITYCLGGGNIKYGSGAYVKEHNKLSEYKRILLTSDGIHEYVSIDELEDFTVGEISEKTLEMLADKARENGSSDDQTIIVIDRM